MEEFIQIPCIHMPFVVILPDCVHLLLKCHGPAVVFFQWKVGHCVLPPQFCFNFFGVYVNQSNGEIDLEIIWPTHLACTACDRIGECASILFCRASIAWLVLFHQAKDTRCLCRSCAWVQAMGPFASKKIRSHSVTPSMLLTPCPSMLILLLLFWQSAITDYKGKGFIVPPPAMLSRNIAFVGVP